MLRSEEGVWAREVSCTPIEPVSAIAASGRSLLPLEAQPARRAIAITAQLKFRHFVVINSILSGRTLAYTVRITSRRSGFISFTDFSIKNQANSARSGAARGLDIAFIA